MKSILSELIKKYPSDAAYWSWRDELKENYPGIMYTEFDDETKNPYVLFRYSIGCDFSDPLVQEARGIILNKYTGDVVCWPFRKFGKYNESYADKIDWTTARVQEKVDGIIIKLWYDYFLDKWVFSTNGVIYAKDATIETPDHEFVSFQTLIEACINYDSIKFDTLDKDKTYIFELCSPENKVVVHYSSRKLYHIGTRNNKTGEESDEYIGIIKPRTYSVFGSDKNTYTYLSKYNLSSIEDCLNLLDNINTQDDDTIHSCLIEGFVVVDGNWNRIKVKSPIYQVLHNIASNSETSKIELIRLIISGKVNISDICDDYPELAHWIKYYDYKVSEFVYEADALLDVSRKLYERSNHSRKDVAIIIKDHKYSGIAFAGLDNNKTLFELLGSDKNIDLYTKIARYIPNYNPQNLSCYLSCYFSNLNA